MKWQAIISLAMLLTPTAEAQWVKFDACGLQLPNEQGGPLELERTQPAPRFGPYWVWVPSVSWVAGATERIHTEPDPRCTIIYVRTDRILVIGTLAEVMEKLKRAMR